MDKTPAMNRYRYFCRASGMYYLQDNKTGKQESLRTKDEHQAERVALHRNESASIATGHRQIAIGYLQNADPEIKTRTWTKVMDYFCAQPNKPATTARKRTAMKDRALIPFRNTVIIDTTPEQMLTAMKRGTVSTNCYLRKLHNLARRMKWLPDDILTRGMWPVVRYGDKRAITLEEHRRILTVTPTPERRQYYEILWQTGSAQTDIAKLTAEQINLEHGTIQFHRTKQEGKAGDVFLVMGPTLEDIILTLPSTGLLFPGLAKVGENDRSTAFAKHCKKASIEGVTLHSYRYAVIQRAKACGYNKRHAMAMVGQTREQTHDAYAKGGATTVPSLEEYELAYRSAQEDRLKDREAKRKKIINLRNHLDAQGGDHREVGSA